jgi:hypothetical protein
VCTKAEWRLIQEDAGTIVRSHIRAMGLVNVRYQAGTAIHVFRDNEVFIFLTLLKGLADFSIRQML